MANTSQESNKIVVFVYETYFAKIIKDIINQNQYKPKFKPAFLRGFIYASKINDLKDTSLDKNGIIYYDYSCAKIYGYNIELEIDTNILINKVPKNLDWILLPVITESFDLEEEHAVSILSTRDITIFNVWFKKQNKYPRIGYSDKATTAQKLIEILEIKYEGADLLEKIKKIFNITKDLSNVDEAKKEIERILSSGDAYFDENF